MISIWKEPINRHYIVPSRRSAGYILYIVFWVSFGIIVAKKFWVRKNLDSFQIEFTGESIVKINQQLHNIKPTAMHMDLDYDRIIDKILVSIDLPCGERIHELFILIQFRTSMGYGQGALSVNSFSGANRVSTFHRIEQPQEFLSESPPKMDKHEASILLTEDFPAVWSHVVGSTRCVVTVNLVISRKLALEESIPYGDILAHFFFATFIFRILVQFGIIPTRPAN